MRSISKGGYGSRSILSPSGTSDALENPVFYCCRRSAELLHGVRRPCGAMTAGSWVTGRWGIRRWTVRRIAHDLHEGACVDYCEREAPCKSWGIRASVENDAVSDERTDTFAPPTERRSYACMPIYDGATLLVYRFVPYTERRGSRKVRSERPDPQACGKRTTTFISECNAS